MGTEPRSPLGKVDGGVGVGVGAARAGSDVAAVGADGAGKLGDGRGAGGVVAGGADVTGGLAPMPAACHLLSTWPAMLPGPLEKACVEATESTRVSASMLPGVAQCGTEPRSPLGNFEAVVGGGSGEPSGGGGGGGGARGASGMLAGGAEAAGLASLGSFLELRHLLSTCPAMLPGPSKKSCDELAESTACDACDEVGSLR